MQRAGQGLNNSHSQIVIESEKEGYGHHRVSIRGHVSQTPHRTSFCIAPEAHLLLTFKHNRFSKIEFTYLTFTRLKHTNQWFHLLRPLIISGLFCVSRDLPFLNIAYK